MPRPRCALCAFYTHNVHLHALGHAHHHACTHLPTCALTCNPLPSSSLCLLSPPLKVAITLRLHALASQAERAGGGLIRLLGNHEIMNYQADFRYEST